MDKSQFDQIIAFLQPQMVDLKEIPQSAYEERTKKHDATIREMLNEIEGNLESLGFTVTREATK